MAERPDEADLWEQIASLVFGYSQRIDLAELVTDALLAGPLRSLFEEAAEAARLRERLREVEAELRELASAALRSGKH